MLQTVLLTSFAMSSQASVSSENLRRDPISSIKNNASHATSWRASILLVFSKLKKQGIALNQIEKKNKIDATIITVIN